MEEKEQKQLEGEEEKERKQLLQEQENAEKEPKQLEPAREAKARTATAAKRNERMHDFALIHDMQEKEKTWIEL